MSERSTSNPASHELKNLIHQINSIEDPASMKAIMRIVAERSEEMKIHNFPEIEGSVVGFIRRLRRNTGFTQSEFASSIGINPTVYNELENDKRKFTPGYVQAFSESGLFDQSETNILRNIAAIEFARREFDLD